MTVDHEEGKQFALWLIQVTTERFRHFFLKRIAKGFKE
jgi:hypothetical protein